MSLQQALDRLWQQLAEQPYEYDLYGLVRRLEALYQPVRPWGRNALPEHEAIRFGQLPSLQFAPSTVRHAQQQSPYPTIEISSFGLFGPNGPLPLHLTEYAHERLHHHKDQALHAFCNIFHHRLISLFYRAWADHQAAISLEQKIDSFSMQLSSLAHTNVIAPEIPSHAVHYYSGLLADNRRHAEGLTQLLQEYFQVPVGLQEHIPHWIPLAETQQWRLGQPTALNKHILGKKVRDAQYKFRLILGPLSYQQFLDFLPSAPYFSQLQAWVRLYSGIEQAWEVQLVLDKSQVPPIRVSQQHVLGRNTWLGKRPASKGHANELLLPGG